MEGKAKHGSVEAQVHRMSRAILRKLKELAWNQDEAGFKAYLSDDCGIKPGDSRYPVAVREFWNLVAKIERERRP